MESRGYLRDSTPGIFLNIIPASRGPLVLPDLPDLPEDFLHTLGVTLVPLDLQDYHPALLAPQDCHPALQDLLRDLLVVLPALLALQDTLLHHKG